MPQSQRVISEIIQSGNSPVSTESGRVHLSDNAVYRPVPASESYNGVGFSSMPKPQLVGYDATTARQIWLLELDEIKTGFAWDELHGQKFVCLCAMDASSIARDDLSRFCSHLINLGCAYFCVWGPDCERAHDIMDEEAIGDNPPATDIGCLMTTWHAKESLVAAVDFFLNCTIPDEKYAPAGCPYGLAVAVGSRGWAKEIEQQLRLATAAD